ncbi:MAG: PASTA domain-containing protein, partial [Solirubrobacteraceae bacterium]
MLTGRVPFDGESPVSIALKHVAEAPVPPSQINPEIPSALEQVVLWSLNKNPADRPADADQFIMALEQVRDALAAPAGEITASMRAIGAGAVVPAGGYPHTSLIPAAEAPAAYGSAVDVAYEGDRLDHRRDDDRHDGNRPVWPWIVGLLVLLLLIGGGVAAYLLTRPKKTEVPTVVYLQLPDAQNDVQNAGFTPNVIPEVSKYPVNEVISQSPLGHSLAKSGSTVTLTYSTGPGNTTVPTLVGDTPAQARAQLKQNGLKVLRTVSQQSSSTPAGQVISTQPGAGASVSKGTAVVLNVSSGQAVPYVVGDSLGDAQAALSQVSGTPPQVKYQTTTTAQPDTVIAQSPSSGQSLPKNGVITLTLAKAPDTVKVPRVVGFPPNAAVAALSGQGLNVNELPQTTHNPAMVNLVVKQYPTSLTVVKKGKVINIYIGQAPGSGTGTGGGTGGTGGTGGGGLGNTATSTQSTTTPPPASSTPSNTTTT